MHSALVSAVALACFASALAVTAWSRVRLAGSRRRAEAIVRGLAADDEAEATCEAAREVQ